MYLPSSPQADLIYCVDSLLLFQYFVEAGAIAVRRVRKEDMRHVAKATGATMVNSWPAYAMILIFKAVLNFLPTLSNNQCNHGCTKGNSQFGIL